MSVAYRKSILAPDPTWVLLSVCAGACVCKARVPVSWSSFRPLDRRIED